MTKNKLPTNTLEVAALWGLSVRQLDYWVRAFRLHYNDCPDFSPGSGIPRHWSRTGNCRVAMASRASRITVAFPRLIAVLNDYTFDPNSAYNWIQLYDYDVWELRNNLDYDPDTIVAFNLNECKELV